MFSFGTIRRAPNSPSFFFNDPATTEIYTLSLHDALPIYAATFVAQDTGYLGTFALDSSSIDTGNGGTVGWSFQVSDRNSTRLASSHHHIPKADVTFDNGQGGTAVQTITVTITGTNEAPHI